MACLRIFTAPRRTSTAMNATGKRILVLEDKEMILKYLQEKLDKLGFQITPASTGTEAVGLLQASQFHGILLDLETSPIDGLALVRQLREASHAIPIIVMSADPTRTTMRKAIEVGAQDFLMKPLSYEILKYKCLRLFT